MIYREYYIIYNVNGKKGTIQEDIRYTCTHNLLSNYTNIIKLKNYIQEAYSKTWSIGITNIIELKVPFFKRLYKTFKSPTKKICILNNVEM